VSHISGGGADAALKYNGKIAGTSVRAGVHYLNTSSISATVDSTYGGSISGRHGSGFGLTFAAAAQDNKNNVEDEEMFYVKGSYLGKFFSLGTTALSIQYGTYDDRTAAGDDYEGYGFSVVQAVSGLGAEFFLDGRVHTFDDSTAVDFEDIWVITAGGRFRF